MENFLPQILPKIEGILASYSFSSSANFQAAVIVVTVFLIAVLLGVTRRHIVSWTMSGAWFGFVFGIIFILGLEATFLVGGRTALFEATVNEKAPPQLRAFLEDGKRNLVRVLGLTTEEIPTSVAQELPSSQSILNDFQSLSSLESETVRSAICRQPERR